MAFTAESLRELRRERNIADYDLPVFNSHRVAADWVFKATDVIRVLEEYAADPARFPTLAAVIAAYERGVLREVTHRPSGR